MLEFLVAALILADIYTTIEAIEHHRAQEANGSLSKLIKWVGLEPAVIIAHAAVLVALFASPQSPLVLFGIGAAFAVALVNNWKYVKIN